MVSVHPFAMEKFPTRSPLAFEARCQPSLLGGVRLQIRAGCVRVVDGLIVNRQLGRLEPLLTFGERRERPVEDSTGEEGPLDGIARSPGVNHAFDRLQQVGEVRVARFGAFFESGGDGLGLPLDSTATEVPVANPGSIKTLPSRPSVYWNRNSAASGVLPHRHARLDGASRRARRLRTSRGTVPSSTAFHIASPCKQRTQTHTALPAAAPFDLALQELEGVDPVNVETRITDPDDRLDLAAQGDREVRNPEPDGHRRARHERDLELTGAVVHPRSVGPFGAEVLVAEDGDHPSVLDEGSS